jgi:uncharacterized protein (TIGR03437 family)
LFIVASIHAQTGSLSVVSAASYRSVIAPDSLAAMFGTTLARSTVFATLDADGNLPIELAFTRVECNGTASPLIFVSPTQINFVVPAGVAVGTAIVTLRSTDTNTTRTTTVQVAATAPALFSSDASGSGPGAILNAVTFTPAPFLTVTPQNGADTSTRLAAYGTGFRHAKNVSATAVDSLGNRYNLTVEFAGAAPGFAGLDQINFVVPAGLDGAGAVSLTVSTEDGISNAVTFQMNLLPLALLQLTGITLSPPVVNGGDTITATVSLNGIARLGGFLVTLQTSNLAALPQAFVTIPQGLSAMDVPIPTSAVATVQTGTITALSGVVRVSANFEVDPQSQVQLAAFSVTPVSTLGGRTLQAAIGLSGSAPGGGVNVQITSDSPAANPPASVAVPFGQSSFSFQIPTSSVNGPQPITFSATANRTTLTSQVTLLPLFTLSVDPNPVIGGSTATGSITLADPAGPGGATIALSSTDGASARVPPFITITQGQSFNTFTINTSQVTGARTATISAIFQGLIETASLTVNPQPLPTLSSLTISPDHITGGQSSQGTVTLAAPAPVGGTLVTLQSSALNVAQVPPTITVPQGFTMAIFNITTIRVPVVQAATITASTGGISRSAVLTVE